MMEKNYTPDGWLGIIMGTKLWIDFCEKHVVTSGLEKLVKQLKDRGRQMQEQPVQGKDVKETCRYVHEESTQGEDVAKQGSRH